MCLIGLALESHPRFSLVVAANRDESFDRPARAAAWWQPPNARGRVLSGRDVQAGGTWLGVNEFGALAALTNVRQSPNPANTKMGDPSRGELPVLALTQDAISVQTHLENCHLHYKPFNLLMTQAAGLAPACVFYRHDQPRARGLNAGIHVLSNATLNTPWPKVMHLHRVLEALPGNGAHAALEVLLLAALQSQAMPRDADLPDTGVGLQREQWLAPSFIRAPGYGTRVSTLITQERDGGIMRFTEWTWSTEHLVPQITQHRYFEFVPTRA
jgi:uncharacterized protein with NRDE domain